MEADLAALQANSKDTLPLTMNERTDAAWKLVRKYGHRLPKPAVSKASGVSQRSILTMRQKLHLFSEHRVTPTGNWWQDRRFPEAAEEYTPPTDAEQEALIAELAEALKEALRTNRCRDTEIRASALERAFGAPELLNIVEFLRIGGGQWDEFSDKPEGEPEDVFGCPARDTERATPDHAICAV